MTAATTSDGSMDGFIDCSSIVATTSVMVSDSTTFKLII